MFPQLSLTETITSHIKSLQSFSTEKDIINATGYHTFSCFIAFILAPIVLTSLLYVYGGKLSDNTISLILTSNSIFVALLLNLIVLLYSMRSRLVDENHKLQPTSDEECSIEYDEFKKNIALKKVSIDFTFANITVQILLSLTVVVLTLIHSYFTSPIAINIIDTLIIFFVVHVVLGVMLILSRLASLFHLD